MSDEEKREYEELKSLLYQGTISQYGKRKLIDIIEKQSKEIEELKEKNYYLPAWVNKKYVSMEKIKAKIEELNKEYKEAYNKGFKTDMVNRLREIKLMQSLLEKE